MSVIGNIGPTPQLFGAAGGPSRADPLPASAARDAARRDDAPKAVAPGGGAPAERTKAPPAKRTIPPATAARDATAGSGPRPGADGDDAAASVRGALSEQSRAETASEAREERARRTAEVEQDRLIAREIMARIPVPVEALPRLTADARRSTEARAG